MENSFCDDLSDEKDVFKTINIYRGEDNHKELGNCQIGHTDHHLSNLIWWLTVWMKI